MVSINNTKFNLYILGLNSFNYSLAVLFYGAEPRKTTDIHKVNINIFNKE